jgi:hypothetical protein
MRSNTSASIIEPGRENAGCGSRRVAYSQDHDALACSAGLPVRRQEPSGLAGLLEVGHDDRDVRRTDKVVDEGARA